MAVRRRGNSYQVDVKVRGKRVRETAHSHSEAVALESEIRAALLNGKEWVSKRDKRVDGHKATTEDYIEIAYKNRWSKAKTGEASRRNAELVADITGRDFPITAWDEAKIDEVVQTMFEEEKLAPGTVNRRLAALSVVLRTAFRHKVLERMPEMPRFKESQGRFWTLDNLPGHEGENFERKMLDFLIDRGENHIRVTSNAMLFHDFCVVMIDTGARNGELYKLKDSDVHNGKVTFWETKTGKNRTVPLTKRALVCLQKHMGNGQPFKDVKTSFVRYWWNEISEHFELSHLQNFSSYCMRHTCASRLARKNIPASTIQKWMGHSTLATTMRYIHMHQSDLDLARDALEEDGGLMVIKGGKT
jgi:integrase